jgi:hypothetical protein
MQHHTLLLNTTTPMLLLKHTLILEPLLLRKLLKPLLIMIPAQLMCPLEITMLVMLFSQFLITLPANLMLLLLSLRICMARLQLFQSLRVPMEPSLPSRQSRCVYVVFAFI